MKKSKIDNKKVYIIFSSVILVLIVAACFCIHSAYNKGVSDGRANYEQETAELLSNLGTVISEKVNFRQSANNILVDVPNEINSDGIEAYIKNLNSLKDSVNTEAVKNIISEYIEKWQNFKDTYETEDNGAIEAAFNELKESAATAATQIKEAYDNQITDALKNLGSN